MKRGHFTLVAAVVVGIMSAALPARAETLLVPWLGVNTGAGSAPAAVGVGGSVGTTLAGAVGVDFDFGYSQDFFGSNTRSDIVTTMGNVTIGVPFGGTRGRGIRPYLTGGFGLIRARVDSPFYRYSITNHDLGVDIGGGLIGFMGAHVGVRADLRYIRSVNDDNSTYPVAPIDLIRVHCWRTSFGLVVR